MATVHDLSSTFDLEWYRSEFHANIKQARWSGKKRKSQLDAIEDLGTQIIDCIETVEGHETTNPLARVVYRATHLQLMNALHMIINELRGPGDGLAKRIQFYCRHCNAPMEAGSYYCSHCNDGQW